MIRARPTDLQHGRIDVKHPSTDAAARGDGMQIWYLDTVEFELPNPCNLPAAPDWPAWSFRLHRLIQERRRKQTKAKNVSSQLNRWNKSSLCSSYLFSFYSRQQCLLLPHQPGFGLKTWLFLVPPSQPRPQQVFRPTVFWGFDPRKPSANRVIWSNFEGRWL